MSNAGRALLDRLTSAALRSVRGALDEAATPRCAPPEAIALLLRQYASTGRDDFRDAAGAALARALHEACVSSSRDDSAAWLTLFVEAVALSDDERLRVSIETLAEAAASAWPARGPVAPALRAIGAVLAATAAIPRPDSAQLLSRAIDEMERIVAHAYTPGAGIVREVGGAGEPGALEDHSVAAAVLLDAYAATGRLPYAMLADELMQFARRQWSEPAGWRATFPDACDACRVMCRLAAVYRDEDYQQAAVLGSVDYAAEAQRVLFALEPTPAGDRDRALYGLAVFELLAIQSAI